MTRPDTLPPPIDVATLVGSIASLLAYFDRIRSTSYII